MGRTRKSTKSAKETGETVRLAEERDFGWLVATIRGVHDRCAIEAGRAVNTALSARNWAAGYCICEYEQSGSDRATYGVRLIETLAERLAAANIAGFGPRTLRQCRQFYLTYPGILQTVSAESRTEPTLDPIWQTVSAKSAGSNPSGTSAKSTRQAVSPDDPMTLLSRLSFSHFVELMSLDDPLQRRFYEVECMRGTWSVRELRRQIGSLYFERSGLSKKPEKLAARVQAGAEAADSKLAIRDPYVFEFLGIKSQEVMGESELEDGLLDKLQTFLLELGHGFCFEARQKRILIGETYGFIDLVFYHRILKCHVLIELKVADFSHEHIGQLNTYVSWYKRNVTTQDDNPPIGLLLCTRKDHSLVEYALADLPNQLFDSKYQLELPTRERLQEFLDQQVEEITDA